jgi:arylformamidase
MKIIDLTIELSEDLPVFPGDPNLELEQFQTFEKDDWNMKRLHLNGHDGTHVNAQVHGQATGKSLDDYNVEDFIGETFLYDNFEDIQEGFGLIVAKQNIDMELAKVITEKKVKFIGLASEFEMDLDVEKYFFSKDILVFERIANTNLLPKKFIFHGVPLKIKDGDGSPIRAYAIVE